MSRHTIKSFFFAQALVLLTNCATTQSQDPEVLPLCVQPLAKPIPNAIVETPPVQLSEKEIQDLDNRVNIDLEADQILLDPSKRPVLLSAILCEASQRQRDIGDPMMDNLSPDHYAAYKVAQHDITNAKVKLGVLDIEPLACTYIEVDQLAQCLSNIPPTWCYKNPHIQAQVKAAERLNAPTGLGNEPFIDF